MSFEVLSGEQYTDEEVEETIKAIENGETPGDLIQRDVPEGLVSVSLAEMARRDDEPPLEEQR